LTLPASDIYSLGITVYEMIAGRVPFTHQTTSRLVEAHLRDVPPDLLSLDPPAPRPVADLVKRMLSKAPLRRPQSCDELIEELTELEIETLENRFAGIPNHSADEPKSRT
jgi:serine/threonine-protein kinase